MLTSRSSEFYLKLRKSTHKFTTPYDTFAFCLIAPPSEESANAPRPSIGLPIEHSCQFHILEESVSYFRLLLSAKINVPHVFIIKECLGRT